MTRTKLQSHCWEPRPPSHTPRTVHVQRGLLNSSGHRPDPTFLPVLSLGCLKLYLGEILLWVWFFSAFKKNRGERWFWHLSATCRARRGAHASWGSRWCLMGRVTLVGLFTRVAGRGVGATGQHRPRESWDEWLHHT